MTDQRMNPDLVHDILRLTDTPAPTTSTPAAPSCSSAT